MLRKLTLIANPGSASRKYALYRSTDEGDECLAELHFEKGEDRVIYTLSLAGKAQKPVDAGINHLAFSATKLPIILQQNNIVDDSAFVDAIGLRVVAPASFFQTHQLLNKRAIEYLRELEPRAELHIGATLQEAELLNATFPGARIVGVSDSAFHAHKPVHANTYGISQKDAKKYDIWRFGYHGLSATAVVETLKDTKRLPKRLVLCHLGSGASITAVKDGKSIDNTMGYSPLEGLVMSTRSGTIDPTAAAVLAEKNKLDPYGLQLYLNFKSGLLGLSEVSDDIRSLLELEEQGHDGAALALRVYVYKVQQAIGQMAASLGGVDGLVFTGTVGERSAVIRHRIIKNMLFLGLSIDSATNARTIAPATLTKISQDRHPAPVLVVPSNESHAILHAVHQMLD